MTTRLKRRTKDLRPGAVLAEDVRDRSGRLLLPAGLAVRENHVRTLQAWGITEVTVVLEGSTSESTDGETESGSEILDPQAVERAEAQMTDIFRHADRGHPFLHELYAISVRRLAREYMKEARK